MLGSREERRGGLRAGQAVWGREEVGRSLCCVGWGVRIPVMLDFGSYTRIAAAHMRGVVIAGVFLLAYDSVRRGSESRFRVNITVRRR